MQSPPAGLPSTSTAETVATFDPKVKIYLVLYVAAILAATFVGLLVLPLWAVAGPWWANLYFPSIQARLGTRSLIYRHGVWLRSEMNIPLDKIQDVSMHHGPILDAFGLATLKIETAGGGQTGSSATLIGVRDAEAFRAKIIERRDAITLGPRPEADESALLREIRDSLLRIEAELGRRG